MGSLPKKSGLAEPALIERIFFFGREGMLPRCRFHMRSISLEIVVSSQLALRARAPQYYSRTDTPTAQQAPFLASPLAQSQRRSVDVNVRLALRLHCERSFQSVALRIPRLLAYKLLQAKFS